MTKRPNTDLTSWPEGALRGCARHAERPEVRARASAELERRTHRPWLSDAEKIVALVNLIAVAGLISIAFWLSGCAFPEEGEGVPACEDCYRPPRPDGYPIDLPAPGEATTVDDPTVASGDGDASTDEGSTDDGPATSDTSSSSTDESGSSSTGEETYEPAHCDMTCPDDAQRVVPPGVIACYCATPCADDSDCGALEWCDPFFARCVIGCSQVTDCLAIDPLLSCYTWTAEHLACAYTGETP